MRSFLPPASLVILGTLSSCSAREGVVAPAPAARSADIVATLDRLGAMPKAPKTGPALAAALPARAASPVRLGEGDAWIEVTPAEMRDVDGATVDRSLVFADASDDLDLVYVRDGGRLEELRLARTRAAAQRARWNVRLGPAMKSVQILDGRIEAVDAKGMVRFSSEPAFAIDAKGLRRPLRLSLQGSTVEAALDTEGMETPIAVDPAWVPVSGPSALVRWGATLTKLSTGKLLYAGGGDIKTGTNSNAAHVFDPATNTWTSTANTLARPRAEHTANAYGTSKKVLIIGGYGLTSTETTAELYDETTNSFTGLATVPAMNFEGGGGATSSERRGHLAVTLPSGDVLVVGGRLGWSEYDNMFLARDLTFTPLTGKLPRPVRDLQGTLLPDGRVLVAGGSSTQGGFLRYQNLAETITVSGTTATVTPVSPLPSARVTATAFVANAGPHAGKAMLLGGAIMSSTSEDQVAPSAGGVIFDPATNAWSPIPNLMSKRRQYAAGGQLPGGKVLLAGGVSDSIATTMANDDAEILDLVTMTWRSAGKMSEPRAGAATAVLADGSLLAVGGLSGAIDGVLMFPAVAAERFALQANGEGCSADGQCTSGFCVDRVCCDRACDGQCEACDDAAARGTCKLVTGAPHGTRERCREPGPSDEPACAQTCDGTSKTCAYAPTTVACSEGSCAAGVERHASTCDGAGRCKDAPISCGDYVCGAAACKTACATKADCSNPAHFCEAGKCIPQQASGAACARDEACASGNCVDGVCCESKCDGQCQACDVPGQAGKCVPIKGRPHSGRPDCAKDASDACKSLACDGTNTAACAATVGPCGNYACDDTEKTCKNTCANNGDCGAGFECDPAGKCVPRTSKCAGLDTMQAADGTKTVCEAYVCRDGACLDKCTTSNDCLNGYACDGATCVNVASHAPPSDGGGCAVGPRAAAPRSLGWLAVLALFALRRRRAR